MRPYRAVAALGAALLGAAMLAATPALAQPWPNKPIRVLVPHAPGGVTDVITRIVMQPLAESLGQPIIVENRPGASGLLGTEVAARAAPDGYTLLMYVDTNTIFPSTVKQLAHDPDASFVPITLLARGSHLVVAHPSVPVSNLKELIVYAKQNPGQLSYASPGTGSPQHLAGETIKREAGIDMTHIPYKGGGQAIGDVVGGQVKLGVLGMAPALPHVKAGKLKVLAVTGCQPIVAASRSADGGGIGAARVLDDSMDGHRCAGGDVAGHRGARVCRGGRGPAPARRHREDFGAWPGSAGQRVARGIPADDPRRDPALAGRRERGRRQARVSKYETDTQVNRPNILFITSDQQRADCYGFEGRRIKTPHLDAMARAGTRFSACITPNLVCQPSRSSILTGLLPRTHGVDDNGIDLPPQIGGARLRQRRFPGMATTTALIGKAHFTTSHTFAPTGTPECRESTANYGPDWYGPYMGIGHVELMIEGHNCFPPMAPPRGQHYERWYHEHGGEALTKLYHTALPPLTDAAQTWNSALPVAFHNSTWIGDRTIDYLREHRDRPFCAWASFPDPHHPFDAPEPWCYLHHPDEVDLPAHRTLDLERRPWWHRAALEGRPQMANRNPAQIPRGSFAHAGADRRAAAPPDRELLRDDLADRPSGRPDPAGAAGPRVCTATRSSCTQPITATGSAITG